MKKGLNKLILPCLCCLSFYTGTQLVGKTEAAFTSQAEAKPIIISTAFVFPSYIHGLEEEARINSEQILKEHAGLETFVKNGLLNETADPSSEFLRKKEQITASLKKLHRIRAELEKLFLKAEKKEGYEFVSKGFIKVDKLLLRINDSLNLQELEQLFYQKWQEQKKKQQGEDIKTNELETDEKLEMPIREQENQMIEHKEPAEEQANPAEEQTVSKDKTQKDEEEEIPNEENPENTE
ncbi:DUF4047 domain-containing protein [Cytobacillus oceanisediminis]|uniref:DUF4047 domain-containing protein n=1 Tax=Cytobacillus oceanisediminis TaxID=665099 RepID=UPI00203ABA60|nr:DUF4047 domain-containing protein [Cytobacillus oceanisediminis]MCM3405797.1 DUF4047 domain-containing protein [Cytobacillus oceanisediminis]MDK7669442.1 DUF4047 domain-containing protein [Cytobacillus oceanisediminis]